MSETCAIANQAIETTITQIRSATLHISFNGVKFLVDPMLSDKGAFSGFHLSMNNHLDNPLVHLPFPMDEIVDVDAVIVTHLHTDHWDDKAVEAIPKDKVIFAQNEDDANHIRSQGFADVRILDGVSEFRGVSLHRTEGTHGTEDVMSVARDALGKVSGVVFKAPGQRSVYLVGDSIFNQQVKDALTAHAPDVVIVNAGFAQLQGLEGSLIMGKRDVHALHEFAPQVKIIATHMEAINHCMLTRASLKSFAKENGFAALLYTPADGETIRI